MFGNLTIKKTTDGYRTKPRRIYQNWFPGFGEFDFQGQTMLTLNVKTKHFQRFFRFGDSPDSPSQEPIDTSIGWLLGTSGETNQIYPWKLTNGYPKNQPIEKETNLNQTSIFGGSMLIFQGVSFVYFFCWGFPTLKL